MSTIIKSIWLLSGLLIFFSSTQCHAQLKPQNSLYLIDIYQINSAYAGLERSLSVNVNYRDQWPGFDQNPNQIYLNAHLPLYLLNGGAGISIQRDKIGALSSNSLKLSYNNIRKTHFGIISGGLGLGFTNTVLDGGLLVTPEGIYQGGNISHEDQILSEGIQTGTRLDYDISLFLGMESIELGIGFSNLLLPNFNIDELQFSSPTATTIFLRKALSIRELVLYPSLLLKTDWKSTQTDLSCLVKNGSVFGGLSLRGYSRRSIDSAVLIAGIKLNQNYTLSYSYDIGISKLQTVSQGAHEINLNFNLNKLIGVGLPPEIIYNPRNL